MRRLILGCTFSLCLWPVLGQTQQVQYTQHSHQMQQTQFGQHVQAKRSRADEMLYGAVSPLASAVYFPFKFTLGTLGSALGGISGFATGGNERAAEGIWWPTTAGRYFITPAVVSGEEPFWPPDVPPAVERPGLIDVEAYIESHQAAAPSQAVSAPGLSAADLEAIRSATQHAQAASEEAQLAAQAADRAAEKAARDLAVPQSNSSN